MRAWHQASQRKHWRWRRSTETREFLDGVRQAIDLQNEQIAAGACQLFMVLVADSHQPWQKHHEAHQGYGHAGKKTIGWDDCLSHTRLIREVVPPCTRTSRWEENQTWNDKGRYPDSIMAHAVGHKHPSTITPEQSAGTAFVDAKTLVVALPSLTTRTDTPTVHTPYYSLAQRTWKRVNLLSP